VIPGDGRCEPASTEARRWYKPRMPQLVLGPLLRFVGEREASVWLETGSPCAVEVRAGDVSGRESTFSISGHHYALVVLTGLKPGTSTPYEVLLDDEVVWPPARSPHPPSRIRTVDPGSPVRVLFGSCREPPDPGLVGRPGLDPDVLDAYAFRMASQAHEEWPDLLVMLGDQMYADETTTKMQAFLRGRRDVSRPPRLEVADFEEYTQLYYESWGVPNIRWLLSTLPTAMIFDDHDVRDDWNTSHAWRLDMQRTTWWEGRITGALMSYWIYQHLGNLSPAALAADETYQTARSTTDGAPALRSFAQAADREADGAKGAMWSFRRDLGGVRLLVIDSRCGRILADDNHLMVGEAEFAWIEAQVGDGQFDHLVIGTSLPWLLPRALHDLESWDEALASGAHGRLLASFGEWLRRAVDLEHWAAFRGSFDRLTRLIAQVGRGLHGGVPPASICVLSGDVHHTYVAETDFPQPVASRVYQITCSPIHNTIPRLMRVVFRVGWSRTAQRVTRFLARRAGVPALPISWHHPTGPHFGNELGLVVFDGRSARVVLERSVRPAKLIPGEDVKATAVGLAIVYDESLTDPPGD
jgi:phosphodiesterase/alkaline phosphatase D-like protein